MALDNPSYFTVPGDFGNQVNLISKRTPKMGNSLSDNASTSSECSVNRPFQSSMNGANKKTMRNLLRSVSSNSADSNQELLIMGEPRLSDIAPDLSLAHPVKEPRRSNSLKHTMRPDNRNDLYSPLPTSEVDAYNADEEVFVDEDSARYYNFSAVSGSTANRRRHSIGTVMARERSVSVTSSNVSFKEDFPQAVIHAAPDGSALGPITSIPIDDHSMRHSSYPRKRCNRCTRAPVRKLSDMDDILIVSVKSSETAALWVEYFTSYFEQISRQANRRPFKVHQLSIEDITEANGDIRFISEKTAAVKLQLIVICPLFLDNIAKKSSKISALTKLLHPNRVLALLLGVTDDDILDVHKNVLTTYSQWQRHAVGEDQDETFTKEFLGTAMTIFTKVWKQQSSVTAQEKSHFSVSPKKVRQGQNSVLILLTHPLQKEDTIKISIERNNELVELKTVKRRNPYTLKIVIPDTLTEVSAIVNVLVEKNGSIIGSRPIKCESRLRELEQILRSTTNPVEFMCQTLGFSLQDKTQLDNWMVHTFQKNLPQNFNVLCNDTFGERGKSNYTVGCEEFPTLLHFAAKYGLEKLAIQLLDCPGGDAACDIRNANDFIPADIAEFEGFPELAQMLRGYMKMNEFSKMYTKLKEISLNPDKISEVDEDYLTPNDVNEFYKICPPPKPLISPIMSTITEPSEMGYMSMHVPAKIQNTDSIQKEKTNSSTKLNTATSNSNISITSSQKESNMKTSPVIIIDKVQTELVEIINDFKNNVHSIDQAEELVKEWMNRNDVQKSFREKTEQLNEMRIKYEKIQQDMKTDGGKLTPFDRIRKIFAWGKNKEHKKTENDGTPVNTRPISSLSIQSTSSSGSSGRMSTISGCSLGDSGTHSDHEDRKNLINSTPEDDFKSIIKGMNYMIPPTPKPIHPGLFSSRTPFPPIEERPPHPVPRPVEEYYIQFPPSGLPVQMSKEMIPKEDNVYIEFDGRSSPDQQSAPTPPSPNADYMNILTSGAPTTEDLDCHEYMNFAPPAIPRK